MVIGSVKGSHAQAQGVRADSQAYKYVRGCPGGLAGGSGGVPITGKPSRKAAPRRGFREAPADRAAPGVEQCAALMAPPTLALGAAARGDGAAGPDGGGKGGRRRLGYSAATARCQVSWYMRARRAAALSGLRSKA